MKEIRFASFSYCTGLRELTIPASVVSIERFGLNNCNSLTDIYYAGTDEMWNNIEIDERTQGNESNDSIYNATIHFNSANEQSNTIIMVTTCAYYNLNIGLCA